MKIGWIGLGAMGTPMASRLYNAGFDISVYNRTESKANVFKEKGVAVYSSTPELANHVDLTFVMLSDKKAIDSALVNDFWKNMSGKIVINMSTISPSESIEINEKAKQYNVTYIEAPVSGSVGAAKAGVLLILTAGNHFIVSKLSNVFQHLGSRTFYLGEIGQGTGTKLSINTLLAQMGVAYSEAMLLAKELGVNTEQFSEVISNSGINSPLFQAKKDMWLQDNYPPAFSLKLMAKDVRLAKNELGKERILPFLSKAEELYSGSEVAGLGELDMASVYHQLEKGNN